MNPAVVIFASIMCVIMGVAEVWLTASGAGGFHKIVPGIIAGTALSLLIFLRLIQVWRRKISASDVQKNNAVAKYAWLLGLIGIGLSILLQKEPFNKSYFNAALGLFFAAIGIGAFIIVVSGRAPVATNFNRKKYQK